VNRRSSSIRRTIQLAVVGVAITVLVAACGSSGGGGGSSATSPNGPTSKLSGASITVGMICSCSGSTADVDGENADVSKAWAAWVNNHGGINGHPVHLITKDDDGSTATNLQSAKELVEQDHVIAIVGNTSESMAASASYLDQHKVPVIGGYNAISPFGSDKNWYPSGPTLQVLIAAITKAAVDAGKHKLGVMYCVEYPVCAGLSRVFQSASNAVHGPAIGSVSYSATASSYAAQCLSLKSQGVDSLYIAGTGSTIVRIIRDCRANGYSPQLFVTDEITTPAMTADPNIQGVDVVGGVANFDDATNPAVTQYTDAVDAYNSKLRSSSGFSQSTIFSWVSGLIFEAAAKAANIGPKSTGADVTTGLNALKDDTFGGITAPITYATQQPAGPGCYFLMKIADKKFTNTNSDKPICFTAAELTALKA
jgi:branched-chain amino acid transport system substrate-binding protein